MKYICFDNFLRASYSFAVEEYILSNPKFQEEYFLLWNTKECLMIGRFQNTIEEINLDYAKSEKIDIVRRNSGGGTIYTDENCWQFSFITWKENNAVKDFRSFTAPVIEALKELGIEAQFSGRNDLLLGNKKFSGNAQFSYKNRFLHHGSILFNVNIERMVKAIMPANEKIISKGIKSVRERVVNLKDFLYDKSLDTYAFRNQLLALLSKKMEVECFSDFDKKEIEKIEKEKFLSWDWNFGNSPDCNFTKSHRFASGEIIVSLFIAKGYIKECCLSGDFFFNGDISEFQNAVVGAKYEKPEILKIFQNIKIDNYFYKITAEELIDCFF